MRRMASASPSVQLTSTASATGRTSASAYRLTSSRTKLLTSTGSTRWPGAAPVSSERASSKRSSTSRDTSELDNRFSTMTEVRRVAWPSYEEPRWSDPLQFQQGIAGSLELFFWAFAPFQQFVGEITGEPVPVFQRIDQAGFKLPLDDRVLSDVDTLLVFGLDHNVTGQEATSEEIESVRRGAHV